MLSTIKSLLLFTITVSAGFALEDQKIIVNEAIFVGNTLACEDKCEVRFPDGDCKVDVHCLMRNLSSFGPSYASREHSFSSSEEGDAPDKHEHQEEGDAPDKHKHGERDTPEDDMCRGKCVFSDKKNNCRLDLICVLDRDVEGTLRFLRDLNVDAETAIELALGASWNDDAARRRCDRYFKGVTCDGPCQFKTEEGVCAYIPNCEIPVMRHEPRHPEEDPEKGYLPEERVVVVRDKRCPGKCEVRDPEGACVVDYDCVRGEA